MLTVKNKSHFAWLKKQEKAEREFIRHIQSVLRRSGLSSSRIRRAIEPMVRFNQLRKEALAKFKKRSLPRRKGSRN